MPIIGTGLSIAGTRSEFFQRFDEVQKSLHWQDLSTRLPSKTAKESYRFLGSVPPLREWGTGRKAVGMFSESYDIENLKYEAALEVDRDEIDDDQTGQIRIRIAELAQRAAQHKDTEIARLLENGGTAGFNSYDGVTFFNAAHASGKSGNQSNLVNATAATPSDPTDAEFRTSLKQAIQTMLSLKDDQGEPMSAGASGLVAVVPPGMLIEATEALNSTLVDQGRSNVLKGAATLVTLPHLSSAEKWYLLKTDVSIRPMIFQDRSPIEFKARTEDSDESFLREKWLFGVRARYRMTYGYWQFAVATTFSV